MLEEYEILNEELEKKNEDLVKENERLKEEYIMLQNASDEAEEEKDKEIERLKADIYEAWDNSTWWRNRYNAIVKQNDDNHKKLVKEQEKIEKAIEYIEIIQYNESYGVKEKDYLNLLDILKGADRE